MLDRPRSTLRAVWVGAVLLSGIVVFAAVGNAHYPIRHWLFWRYAAYWGVSATWALSCASAGHFVLCRVLRLTLPPAERILMSFAAGVVVFFWGWFSIGIAGLYRPWCAVAWPAALILLETRPRALFRWTRRVRLLARRPFSFSPLELSLSAGGLAGMAMIYFSILSPDNIGFDARWYHLPIAEHFIAAGGVVPFSEGWYLGTYPHLASFLYCWAFLLPGAELFDRVLMAAHLELVFFVATMASLPLLVARLLGERAPRASWAAMFLFPGIFLYDGSLFTAADHVLAFFGVPLYLALHRALRDAGPSRYALLSLLLAGALLTKYQAVYMLAPIVATIAYRFAAAPRGPDGAEQRRRVLRGAGLALGLGAVLTAPHWLANLAWYGDPLYPMLHGRLASRPWTAVTGEELDIFMGTSRWRLLGPLGTRLLATARALFTFSFEPHDWPTYHGDVPVFGSLFTITSLAVLAIPRARRVAHLALCTLAGVGIWYWTSYQDRYLQSLVPWMAAVTAAIAALVWRDLPKLRVVVVALFGLQIVWGGDVYFLPSNDASHEIDRPSPIKSAVDLLSSGYRGDYVARLHPYAPWEEIGASLPEGAKVLLHERYTHLGLGRMSVSDLPGWQGGISYRDTRDPAAIFHRLASFGVTHVLWEAGTSHGLASVASDLAFYRFATQYTGERRAVGRFVWARMPAAIVEERRSERVAWYDCADGAGRLHELARIDEDEPTDGSRIEPLREGEEPSDDAGFTVVTRGCRIHWRTDGWHHAADRAHHELWVRAVDGAARPASIERPASPATL